MRKWPATVLAALALAACGDAADQAADATPIRQAVNRWSAAVVRHDSAAACAQLSRALRDAIDRHLLGEGVDGSCRTWAARWVSARHPASHRGLHIAAVRAGAEHATVTLTAPGAVDGSATLVKQDGSWRIDDY